MDSERSRGDESASLAEIVSGRIAPNSVHRHREHLHGCANRITTLMLYSGVCAVCDFPLLLTGDLAPVLLR